MAEDKKGIMSFTREEALSEVSRLRKLYPVVHLVDELAVTSSTCLMFEGGATCAKQVCAEVMDDHINRQCELRLGNEVRRVTMQYVEVDGKSEVLMFAMPVDSYELVVDKSVLFTDTLTGVYNRRYFEEEIRLQPLYAGVAMMDLNDFKIVNDTLGHFAGDQALKETTRAIRSCIRDSDILIRYGGDEFVLIMPNIEEEVFKRRLFSIGDAVAHASIPGFEQVSLSISIGGVISRGMQTLEAVQKADELLYRSKASDGAVVTDFDVSLPQEPSKPIILIADDYETNRMVLSAMLEDTYEIIEATDGVEAMKKIDEYGKKISLILLDLIMPNMNGFEVLARMSHRDLINDIPVIMISSDESEESVLRAYELGASDYVGRPFDHRVVRQRVSNVTRLYARQRKLNTLLAQQYNERVKSSSALLSIMGSAMELRNGESGPHVMHVRNITELLLDALIQKTDHYQLMSSERATIVISSALHDMGKLAIPDDILNKPGKLTDEEFDIMKTHTVLGAEMLDNLHMYSDNKLLLKTTHDICRWHHERYDGKGYPDGLVGDEIPISAQVVAIADVYDALTSERVYKSAIPHEQAIQMILNGECGAFNPLLIECLTEIADTLPYEIDEQTLTPPNHKMTNSEE